MTLREAEKEFTNQISRYGERFARKYKYTPIYFSIPFRGNFCILLYLYS